MLPYKRDGPVGVRHFFKAMVSVGLRQGPATHIHSLSACPQILHRLRSLYLHATDFVARLKDAGSRIPTGLDSLSCRSVQCCACLLMTAHWLLQVFSRLVQSSLTHSKCVVCFQMIHSTSNIGIGGCNAVQPSEVLSRRYVLRDAFHHGLPMAFSPKADIQLDTTRNTCF